MRGLRSLPIMSPLARYRFYAVNALIAVIVAMVLLDTMPATPKAVRAKLTPVVQCLGIHQGEWNLFAPDPDKVNTKFHAEITYRDGERREWEGPDWGQVSAWNKWVGHRHVEWCDHVSSFQQAWEPWCRVIARTQRPEMPDADRGAIVRVVYHNAINAPAAERPWRSIHDPAPYNESWVLTIERLE
jgi:hypothetical protein